MTPAPISSPPDNVGPFSGTRQRIKLTPTNGTVHLKPMRQHNRPGREAAVYKEVAASVTQPVCFNADNYKA